MPLLFVKVKSMISEPVSECCYATAFYINHEENLFTPDINMKKTNIKII